MLKNEATNAIDANLIRKCLQGDDRAWESIVRRYARPIFRLTYRYAGRREEAEDLTQEIFLRIYENLCTYRAESGTFNSWVYRLGRNLIIDRWRHTRFLRQCGGPLEDAAAEMEDQTSPSPHRSFEQREAARLVRAGLRNLSPENQEAVILCDLQGMGYQEMSAVLGVPEGTVKSRISRGRLALARELSRTPAWKEMVA
jgi:RNA polymerase sigma-70 factor (ECF subfamily)